MSEQHSRGHEHHHAHHEPATRGGLPVHPRWFFVLGAVLMILVVLVWTLLL